MCALYRYREVSERCTITSFWRGMFSAKLLASHSLSCHGIDSELRNTNKGWKIPLRPYPEEMSLVKLEQLEVEVSERETILPCLRLHLWRARRAVLFLNIFIYFEEICYDPHSNWQLSFMRWPDPTTVALLRSDFFFLLFSFERCAVLERLK